MDTSTAHVTRRRLLGGVASTAVLGGAASLAGCVSDPTTDPTPGPSGDPSPAGSAGALPTYRAFADVTPDLPGTDVLMPTYLSYPDPAVPYPADGMLEGETITTMVMGNSMPIVSVDRNSFWQELNTRLGGQIEFDVPPSAADYQSKFSVRMSGGDLPDIFNIRHRSTPQLGGLIEARCQDLTDFLAGDKVFDFPALAALPTESWRAMTYQGRLYGIPYPQASLGNALIVRTDLMEAAGVTGDLSNGEDLIDFCRAMTDPTRNRWAATQPAAFVSLFQEMLGAPNQWREEGGTFTHTYETPETERAIELVAQMWAEELFDPDAYGNGLSPYRTLPTGRIAMMYGGWQQWGATIRDNLPLEPDYGATGIALPAFDGSGLARKHLGSPASVMISFKKSDDEARVRKLLALSDWFASPFGTDSFKFCRFGLPEVHHTESDGVFSYTEKGTAEVVGLPKDFIGTSGTIANWQPMGLEVALRAVHDYQTTVMTDPVRDPSIGLYSSTDTTQGPSLAVLMSDHINEIIQGRQPISTWQTKVDEWRSTGGDQIRTEYEESLQAAGES